MKKVCAVSRAKAGVVMKFVFTAGCFLIAAFVAGYALPAAAQVQVQITDLGTLGGRVSTAYDINNAGQIVGYSTLRTPGTDMDTGHAFLWENSVLKDLGAMEGDWSIAWGMNNTGQIVGASVTALRESVAFLLHDGTMSSLGTLGGKWSWAKDINDLGQVVGLSNPAVSGYESHAFLWQNGTMVDLGTLGGMSSGAEALNNIGQIVGWSQTADGEIHAVLWDKGEMIDLGTFGGRSSEAHGINDKGQVVGFSTTAAGRDLAFLWEDGKVRIFEPVHLNGFSRAYDINNIGQIVGVSDGVAVMWQYGVMNLLDIYPDTWISAAYGINEKGQIVGFQNMFWRWPSDRAVLWTIKSGLDMLKELSVLVAGGDVQEGTVRGLSAMLDSAIRALEADNTHAACGMLTAFQGEVSAQIDKGISPDQANQFIEAAQRIGTAIGCR